MGSRDFSTVVSSVIVAVLLGVPVLIAQPAPGETKPPDHKGEEAVLFENPPEIETASLYTQSLKDAPANVTVITEQDIRRYGYRTLAEALANVRGLYFTTDGYLQYPGARGFSLPGSFNTRILVMVNGHNMTDNVYGSMHLFGQDFGIDMLLVQRIEIVRGPSSALYGTNGIFATVNIFTRPPADSRPLTVATEFGSFGEKKMHLSSSVYLGHGANLLVSLSGFQSNGRTAIVSPFAAFAGGTANKVGGEQGYHTFAQLTFQNWNVMANFSDRRMIVPFGLFGTDFGDPGTNIRNAHNFVDASWSREVGKESSIRLRFSYDQARYFGRFDYTFDDGPVSDLRDEAEGDWVGSRMSFRTVLPRVGALTVGGQFSADVRNRQRTYYYTAPDDLQRDTSKRDAAYGVFAQQEWNVSRRVTAYFGLRLDDSQLQSAFLSPKVALVYKPSEQTSYKVMYGRAFRNPSTYERFWEPNPLLRAERMNTYEISAERTLAKNVELVTSVFHYRLDGMIEGVAVSQAILQFRNVSASRSTGAEVEIQARPVEWLQLSAALSGQRTRYADPSRVLPNSPARLASFRAAFPVWKDRLNFSTATRYMSGRQTLYGTPTPGVPLADLTLTTARLPGDCSFQFGVRNLLDKQYGDPLSKEHSPAILPRAGRTIFLSIIWRQGE